MPKKFRSENTKAVEARARKAAAADADKAKKKKEAEDAYWTDDNKSQQRKQLRKAEKDQKKADNISKKRERDELYNSEMDTLKSAKAPVSSKSKQPTKVTRAQILENSERAKAEKDVKQAEKDLKQPEKEEPIEENINRILADQVAQGEITEARSVTDAISLLSVETELDRHPERRMKAAYTKFEDENIPRLKKEHPNLRMSQLRQILKKDWQKSLDNPMNQRFVAYNAKK